MTRRRRDSGQTPLDWAVEALMAATLVFLPLAYGTTQPWSQEIYFWLVAIMGLCTLLRSMVYRDRIVWTWAYVPIALFIALVVLQRVPLPRGVLGAISPHTLTLRDDVLAGLPSPANVPLTFYGLATERQLRLVLSVATIFVVVVQSYRTPERRRRLLVSMAGAGMAVALVAAYQDLTRADMIYGTVPVGHRNAGPFQNYSHFSQFMNLSIGAALAWLLMSLAGWSNGWRDATAAREQAQMAENAFVWPAAALIVGGPLLIFASLSRMGMISMLVAGAITAGLLGWRGRPPSGRRRRSNGPPKRRGASVFYVATFAVSAVALLSVFGFDWVFDRLGTLSTQHETPVGIRQNVIRDLIPLWKQFPLLGTGIGTHEFVFPLFNRQPLTTLFTHAENEYAQLMEEAGATGVTLAAAFLAAVGVAFFRVIRSPQRPEQYAAFGLGFGLIAVLIHSASDFGQHVPAAATLTAICCGLLICLSRSLATDGATSIEPASLPLAVALKAAATLAFVTMFGWVTVTGAADRRAAAHFAEAQEAMADVASGHATDDDFARLVAATTAARDAVPIDVVYAHWLGVATWQKLVRDTTDATAGKIVLTSGHLDEVRALVADLDTVRLLCPMFGPPLGLAGQLRARILVEPVGDEQIALAYRLTPHDRELCRLAGLLAVRQRRWDDASTILGRYVRLGGPMWEVVDAFCAANRPDLAQAATADDWRNLKRLGDGLAAGWPKEQVRAAECLAEADRLLVATSDRPAAAELSFERGRLEERYGRVDEAVHWYQKAVEADYDRPDWHLTLAKGLLAIGKAADAERELRVCLRQRPNWDEAARLLMRTLRPPSTKPVRL